MKRHALITGICGFIGSNLARKLIKEGWKVDGVDDLSSGRLENLDGLDIRVIPTGEFLQHFEEVEAEVLRLLKEPQTLVVPPPGSSMSPPGSSTARNAWSSVVKSLKESFWPLGPSA